MKSNVLTLFSFFVFILNGSAQITLTQSAFPPSVLGADSLKVSTYNAVFPVLNEGAGNTWDLSTVTDSTPVFFAYRLPTTSYQFADSNYYNLFSFAYEGSVQSSIFTTDIVDHGVNVRDSEYNIAFMTTSAFDSFIIPNQHILYSSPHTRVVLPATYNSAWAPSYHKDLLFELSVAFYSYNHAPGISRKYISEQDTITGWGKMRVKDIGGNPSIYWDVLQVRTTTITTDSFFLNGGPMPGTILLLFNLIQGTSDTTYVQNYYRLGEVTPLASVRFKDAAYTQPYRATAHVQRLTPPQTSIENTEYAQFATYPNPVTGDNISVTFPVNGITKYTLTDMQGRNIVHGQLDITNQQGKIKLPATVRQGVHMLQLGNSRHNSSTQIEIIR